MNRMLLALCCAAAMLPFAGNAQDTPPPPGRGPRPPMPPRFEVMDTDSSGSVSQEEFLNGWKGMLERQFTNRDADQDGVLSAAELAAEPGPPRGPRGEGRRGEDGPPPPPPGGTDAGPPGNRPGPPPGGAEAGPPPGGEHPGPRPGRMQPPKPEAFDANQDGKVTKEEFTAAWGTTLKEHFKSLDKDADGSLAKEELPVPPGRGPRPGGGEGPPPPTGERR